MALAELVVETREKKGKGVARRLRRQGKIPAVRYGSACPVSMYAVDRMAVERLVAESAGALVALNVDGQGVNEELISIIKDTQRHPVTGWLTHVDFYGVRYGEPIQVEVPVVLEGKAAGVAEGGLLQPVRRTLEIRCLPKDIPENIVIDVTPLGVGDAIHVNDLEVEGIEFIATTNFTIVTVQSVSSGVVTDEDEEGEELEEIETVEEE